MSKKQVTLSLDKKLLKHLDEKRALVSRTAFVEKILFDVLGGNNNA